MPSGSTYNSDKGSKLIVGNTSPVSFGLASSLNEPALWQMNRRTIWTFDVSSPRGFCRGDNRAFPKRNSAQESTQSRAGVGAGTAVQINGMRERLVVSHQRGH